jgi:phage baseplate assembly protein W
MATFIGFNTIDQFKKFTLVDYELIKRDLLNAFNIRQGQLPGRPEYGTIIWDFMFESQDQVTQQRILQEVQRVVGGDPRLNVSDIQCYPQDNGILIELQVAVVPSTDAQRLSVFFDEQQRRSSYV